MYYQIEASECGLVCLGYAASRLGAHYEISELRRRFPVSSRGLTLRQLIEVASALDLHARAVKCETEEFGSLKLPAILHWGLNHFVVLERITKTHLTIHDPARGKVKIPTREARKLFTGIAV